MKKGIDFTRLSTYDWTLFTAEDYRLYREILEASPYDPELARFFYEQKRTENRLQRQESRHRSQVSLSSALNVLDEGIENIPRMEEIEEAFLELPERDRARLSAHLMGLRKKEIALAESVSLSSVGRSIKRARKQVRTNLYG